MMRKPPYRRKAHACIHPETYRYFFRPEDVAEVWRKLSAVYGPVARNESFRTQEIGCAKFYFRATMAGNPLTVIRRRSCGSEDVDAFHRLVGFDRPAATTGRKGGLR